MSLPDCAYIGGNEDPSKCNSSRCPRHGHAAVAARLADAKNSKIENPGNAGGVVRTDGDGQPRLQNGVMCQARGHEYIPNSYAPHACSRCGHTIGAEPCGHRHGRYGCTSAYCYYGVKPPRVPPEPSDPPAPDDPEVSTYSERGELDGLYTEVINLKRENVELQSEVASQAILLEACLPLLVEFRTWIENGADTRSIDHLIDALTVNAEEEDSP